MMDLDLMNPTGEAEDRAQAVIDAQAERIAALEARLSAVSRVTNDTHRLLLPGEAYTATGPGAVVIISESAWGEVARAALGG